MLVTSDTYNQLVRKSKGKNVLMYFYFSTEQNSQALIYPFFSSAIAFKVVFLPLVDRSRSSRWCSPVWIALFRRTCANICRWRWSLRSVYSTILALPLMERSSISVVTSRSTITWIDIWVGNLVSFHVGTFISLAGGLNEKYGRDEVLDELAHRFMEEVQLIVWCDVGHFRELQEGDEIGVTNQE